MKTNDEYVEEFRCEVDKYQLFTNEDYADHLPYDAQQEHVEQFFRATLEAKDKEADERVREDILNKILKHRPSDRFMTEAIRVGYDACREDIYNLITPTKTGKTIEV